MRARVLVVGGGPVGLTMALLLVKHGLRVTLVEREHETRRCVRTVALDDESLRIWQACGLEQRLLDDWDGGPAGELVCQYLTPGGRVFLGLRRCEGDLGYPQAVAVHEGRIAETLASVAERHPDIEFLRGRAVVALEQDAAGVSVGLRADDGTTTRERADWVVACDGGASTVRGLLGVDMRGETLDASWLVANVAEDAPVLHATIRCDPRRPSVMVSVPHGVRRIECLLRPDEVETARDSDDARRRILAEAWDEAAHREILGAAVLRFEARIAERWRVGRVFLAGDAAHLSPPFAGQGLAAGLRDAANLSFKLAGAAQGWLDPFVLDTYEAERRPHQERLIRLALRLGRLMTPRSTIEALVSQGAVRLATALPGADRLLHLRGRAIRPRYDAGFVGAGHCAGSYLPQPVVFVGDGAPRRLDELLGERMTLLAIGVGDARATLQGLEVASGDTVLVENRDFRDPERLLQRTLGAGAVVLVRPDRIIHSHFAGPRIARRGATRAPRAASNHGAIHGIA